MFREEQFAHTFQQKGWTQTEIREALRILKKAEEKKRPFHKFLENHLFSIALLKAFIANLFATTLSIPFILYFQGRTLYVFLATLGLALGILLHSVLKQVENLETKHHTLAFIILSLTILIKFRIGLHIAMQLASYLQLNPLQDPWAVTFSYLLPYIFPYAYLLLEEKKWI